MTDSEMEREDHFNQKCVMFDIYMKWRLGAFQG